jgi:pyruvate/2-oxoglutarate dehydrogenase complex dihydrolipoamide acyltransferase (E2) component
MDRLGKYEIRPFSKERQNIVLVTSEGKRKRGAYALLEVDVTKAKDIIKKKKAKKSGDVSFTGWIIKCVAQVASEHKIMNAYRLGRRKIVVFDDVDVSMPVERQVNGKPFLMGHIIRKANEKSISEITKEIRNIQNKPVDPSLQVLADEITSFERWVLKAPFFIKKIGLVLLRGKGKMKKRHLGTIGVTAIGMKGRFPGYVIGMGGPIATLLAVGGIIKKPGVVNGKIAIREYLHVTIHIDHDVVDGGPLARFTDRFVELLETGFSL